MIRKGDRRRIRRIKLLALALPPPPHRLLRVIGCRTAGFVGTQARVTQHAPGKMDEEGIAQGFVARRPDALERAYSLWSKDLFSVAFHVTRDRALAEDCVHDALMRVWQARNSFRGDTRSLRAYLIGCVRNEALSSLRSDSRRAGREARAARLEMVEGFEEELLDPVESVRLHAALARLPDEQRIALQLAYFGNKTQSEISAELGVPLGTIKSRIALAMRKLQGELLPIGSSL